MRTDQTLPNIMFQLAFCPSENDWLVKVELNLYVIDHANFPHD